MAFEPERMTCSSSWELGDLDVVIDIEFACGFVGVVQDVEVRLLHVATHVLFDELLELVGADVENGRGRADTGRVPHDLAAVLLGDAAEVHRDDVPVVLLGGLFETDLVDVFLVEQSLVVEEDAALAEVVEVLVQRFQLLFAVVGSSCGFRAKESPRASRKL